MDILKREVAAKGGSQVARELGVSKTTVSLVCNGRYGASTAAVERKVMNIYGSGAVECPILGRITAMQCAENHQRAGSLGRRATGNPRTLRIYHACKRCLKRG